MSTKPAGPDYSSLHVLIVEDDGFMRKLEERVVREMRVGTVSVAVDGQEGLEILRTARPPVDFVICDLLMPKMNGLELIHAVRHGGAVADRDIPILIVTTQAEEEIVRGAAAIGADGYLVKPISRSALESRLAATLARRKASGGDPQART